MGRLQVVNAVVASKHEADYVVCCVGSWLAAQCTDGGFAVAQYLASVCFVYGVVVWGCHKPDVTTALASLRLLSCVLLRSEVCAPHISQQCAVGCRTV
jgi:hypothetical protein